MIRWTVLVWVFVCFFQKLELGVKLAVFFAAAKKERLFATLLIITFNPAKIAVFLLGNSEGSE